MDPLKVAVLGALGFVVVGVFLTPIPEGAGTRAASVAPQSSPNVTGQASEAAAEIGGTPFESACASSFARHDKKFAGDATLEAGCNCIYRRVSSRMDSGALPFANDILDTLVWAAGDSSKHMNVSFRLLKAAKSHGYDGSEGQAIVNATLKGLQHCSIPSNI